MRATIASRKGEGDCLLALPFSLGAKLSGACGARLIREIGAHHSQPSEVTIRSAPRRTCSSGCVPRDALTSVCWEQMIRHGGGGAG